MKVGFDCMGQVNCFVRKGTGTILSPLPPLNLGKCLAEGEVTVMIASIVKVDIWFVFPTSFWDICLYCSLHISYLNIGYF